MDFCLPVAWECYFNYLLFYLIKGGILNFCTFDMTHSRFLFDENKLYFPHVTSEVAKQARNPDHFEAHFENYYQHKSNIWHQIKRE